jgi:biotin carboxyl carrier protein
MNEIEKFLLLDVVAANSIPVIEIFSEVGDVVEADDPLLTLESNKEVMEVPPC